MAKIQTMNKYENVNDYWAKNFIKMISGKEWKERNK